MTLDNTKDDSNSIVSGHLFLLICSISLVSLVVWAHLGRLDIVTVAQGIVVPSSKISTVQHLEGGIIREIIYKEGEKVKKGAPLIVLEGASSSADLKEVDVRLITLRIDITRLRAELDGKNSVTFKPDLVSKHKNLTSSAIKHFNTRRRHISNLISSQRQSVVQIEGQAKELQARISKIVESLKLINEQIVISTRLLKEDLTNRMTHLDLLKERALWNGELREAESSIRRIAAAKVEAKVRMLTIRDHYLAETRSKFDQADSTFRELSQRRKKLKDKLKRTVIRAPVDGLIKYLYHSTIGGIVKPGGTVLDIVPEGDKLLIEAQLPVQEVIYVASGQTAKVRPLTPDAANFSQLEGRVIHVSPDSIREGDKIPFYLITIELERESFNSKGKEYPLLPGIQVTCSIRTGERSVLEYLIGPFMSIPSTALHER
jgi:adhesin transport system membrane fusion protein